MLDLAWPDREAAVMPEATCRRCHEITEHKHLHDAAHGLPGTHMAGTERFVCTKCGLTTHALTRAASPSSWIDERDMPSMPSRYELAAIADELVADIQRCSGGALDERSARAVGVLILSRLLSVRARASHACLGSPLTRGRDDD
jgi:hypothetical protein